MEKKHVLLLQLINTSINNKPINKNNFVNINWNMLYEEAVTHNVHGIIYKNFTLICQDTFLINKYKSSIIFNHYIMHINCIRIGEVLRKLRENGIQVVALKGIVLKNYYKEPENRYMGDVDILVKNDEIESTDKILSDMGYECKSKNQKKHLIYYHKNFLPIEVHNYLIDEFYFNNAEQFEKDIWDNLVEKSVCEVKSFTLSNEYFLLHIILHMLCHFVHDGFGLNQLCDLVLFIKEEQSSIDWDVVLLKAREYNIERFLLSVLYICQLLFDSSIILLSGYRTNKYDNMLINDILSAGVFGQKNNYRFLANIFLKYKIEKTRYSFLKLIFSFMFPSKEYINEKFTFTIGKIYLLPIAWFQHIFLVIKHKKFKNIIKAIIKNKNEINNIIESRYVLKKEFGIVNTKNKKQGRNLNE